MEDVKNILRESEFAFKKQFGQNFITDWNLLRAIVSDAGVGEETTVVEIGPGAGTLTKALSERAKQVYSFEIDRSLQPVLARTLSGVENVEVIFRDFMKVDLSKLEEKLPPYTVVANIPYYITTPLVMRFVEESEKVQTIVVMVQEEVARRFCAEAGSPDYGAVTAGIALRGRAKILRKVPKTLFYPVPKVDSAIVRIDIGGGVPVLDKKTYRDVVRCAFSSRRKTLENNLMNSFSLSREEAREILKRADIDEKARGETLSPARLAALADLLYRRG
ncbi:MAG: ribosomal RNA small subunit methyltransferase A [Clostridia bacterium]|nr:ribosomal RNA small subunit methyltransferase A [Clostridia bacterium]